MCDITKTSKDIWFTCDGNCIHTTKMYPGIVQKFVETVNKTYLESCGEINAYTKDQETYK